MKIRVTGEKPADSIAVNGGRPTAVIEVAAGLVSSVNGRQGGVTGLAEAADLQVHEDATTGVHGIADTAALLTEVPFDDTAIRDITQNSLPGVSTAAARADHTHGGASGSGGGLTGIYDVTKAPYNAVGNGIADDYATIEAALAAAYTAGGGTVYLPPGRTYAISGQLHILSNTTVVAYGATVKGIGNTSLARLSAAGDTTTTGYNGQSRIRVFGGIWDVNASDGTTGVATGSANGFILSHNSDVTFRDVTIRNVSTVHGMDISGSQNVKILDCRFEGFKDNTVDQSSSFREAIQIDYSIPDSGGAGAMDNTPCRNILVSGCWFGPSARLGPYGRAIGSHTSVSATTWCDNIQILGNRIEGTLQGGIRVYAWRNVIIADNIISNTGNTGILVTGPDPATAGYANVCQNIDIRGNTVAAAAAGNTISVTGFATARPTGLRIIANNVTGSAANGIYVSQANAPQVCDNRVLPVPSSSLYVINSSAPVVTGNHISGSGGTALGVDTCTGGHVTTNVVDGSSGHGILVSGGSNVTVATNRIVGATGSGIRATSSTVRPRIIGNTILRNGVTATWGLDVTASATDGLIINNDLSGSSWPTGTAYNLVGTRQILDWTGAVGVAVPGQNIVS
ncbi:right-handed parallel beta-helix repeat-containing protein [Streptomyces flaveolus]|uniref:right-handed parallel beta-helix repeat-containing protein n=1 Tax=Streptomyces flaveolus TaxID=67297 RepID=UPI0033DF5447